MATTCIACNNYGTGMINIYNHPNKLDSMFSSLTGIQVHELDSLCILCYDDLKLAFNFRQKCIQNQYLREGTTRLSTENQQYHCATLQVQPTLLQLTNRLENEISTTTIASQQYSEKLVEQEYATNEDMYETSSNFNELIIRTETTEDKKIDDPIPDVTEDETQEEEEDEEPEDLECDEEEEQEEDEEDEIEEKSLNVELEDKKIIFTCELCNKSYSREHNFQRHMKLHTSNEVSKEDTSIATRSQSKTNRTLSENDIYYGFHELMCKYCFQEFISITDKTIHEKSHESSKRPYKCKFDKCDGTFKAKIGLQKHYRIHSQDKPYECRYCDKKFRQRGNALSHERVHTGEKPFLCPQCGKGFAESGNLKSHIRFHSGERPYPCPNCPKRFRTHYSHKIHIRSHTQERPYACDDCGKCFFSSGKLVIHKRIHTGVRPYKCTKCQAAFTESSGLRRHSRVCNNDNTTTANKTQNKKQE